MRRLLPLVLTAPALSGCATDEPEPGWTVTVYYTAVETFHDGAPVEVFGCPTIECGGGIRQ